MYGQVIFHFTTLKKETITYGKGGKPIALGTGGYSSVIFLILRRYAS